MAESPNAAFAGPIETGVCLRKADGAWKVTDVDVCPKREDG
jgi:hypothetical protein